MPLCLFCLSWFLFVLFCWGEELFVSASHLMFTTQPFPIWLLHTTETPLLKVTWWFWCGHIHLHLELPAESGTADYTSVLKHATLWTLWFLAPSFLPTPLSTPSSFLCWILLFCWNSQCWTSLRLDRSLNAMGTQRKDNRLSRIIKEGNTEDATFELGLKGWVGVWEAKTSNHFIIHNIWGLDC